MNNLNEIFEAFDRLKVLVIGDVMIDSYIWGDVNRISPEAPVPIVNVSQREQRLGGAANVALNLQSLGATPILCSVIGADIDGDTLMRLVATNGLPFDGIVQSHKRITTVKHRILAGSQQLLRVDSETTINIDEEDKEYLLKRIQLILPNVDVVIFEDYDKGVITPNIIQQVVKKAQSHNIPTVVDPKKRNFLDYKGVSLFKPNLKEIKEGLNVEINPHEHDSIINAVVQLQERLDIDNVLLTLSEKGVYIRHQEQELLIPAFLREIADVSGAGDTVISIAALCMALDQPLPFVAALSNLGGGLVCEHLGVVPIDKEDLFQEANLNELLRRYGR